MLNWIVWNITVYIYKNGFGIKWPTMVDMLWNPTNLYSFEQYWFLSIFFFKCPVYPGSQTQEFKMVIISRRDTTSQKWDERGAHDLPMLKKLTCDRFFFFFFFFFLLSLSLSPPIKMNMHIWISKWDIWISTKWK